MRTLSIAALNIALPRPHAPQKYEDLWFSAFEGQTPVRLRGETGGLVGSATKTRGTDFIYGDLLKFVNIANSKWLDLSTREPVKQEDVERHVTIPETYRPNLHTLPYMFFPEKHRLIFISRLDQNNVLSPNMAKTLVERFLSKNNLITRFGEAVVTVEPDRETLPTIFKLKKLKHIELEIRPPNALGDVERELMRFLEEQNASSYRQEFDSDREDGLQLTNEVRDAARVAQSNGYVTARGVDNRGRVVTLSTRDHAYESRVSFDPNAELALDIFENEASRVLHEVSRPINRRE